jgi:hypothetical protein
VYQQEQHWRLQSLTQAAAACSVAARSDAHGRVAAFDPPHELTDRSFGIDLIIAGLEHPDATDEDRAGSKSE